MSVKLASHTKPPPGGYIWIEKETSWDNRKASPQSVWDIRKLATDLQIHRRANHARYPYLSLNYADILKEIDLRNAERVSQIPNCEQYVTRTGETAIPKTQALPHQFFSQKLQAVAAGLTKMDAGRLAIGKWEKDGFPQVPQEQAEARALVCVGCPKNEKGDWTRWFTGPAAHMIAAQINKAKAIKMHTDQDEKLVNCVVCLCPLFLKVHMPMPYIQAGTTDEKKAAFAQVRTESGKQCWITTEWQ